MHLLRAGVHRGERVRGREPEVVVTVDRDTKTAVVRGEGAAHREHRVRELLRLGVSDGVRNVDVARARARGLLEHRHEEMDIRACRVLGRELDLVGVLARAAHRAHGAVDALAGRHAQHAVEVDLARADEHVDALACRGRQSLCRGIDVAVGRAGQRDDRRSLDAPRDVAHRLELFRGGGREAGLDRVHPEVRERLRHPQLRGGAECRTRCLLAIAEGRVEDLDLTHHNISPYSAAATASAARGVLVVVVAASLGTSRRGSHGIIRRSARPTSSMRLFCSRARCA